MLAVLLESSTIDQDVVDVRCHKVVEVFTKSIVHILLEGARGVTHSKGYY